MNTKFIITRNAGILAATALGAFAVSGSMASPADKPSDADNFYKSGRVSQQEVKFNNQYRMKVAGNLFLPKDMDKEARCPAIIVGHPMGAVKEQSANLYAAKMAERGFVTLALDLPFWGRERRRTQEFRFSGYVCGGVQRGRGLFGHAAFCGPGPHRRDRDMR